MSLINTRTLLFPIVALLSPWLWSRVQIVPLFWKNAPDVIPRHYAFGGDYEIKFADRLRSCEDVILLEDHGVALTACDPGRERHNTVMGIFHPGPVASADLYLYDYKSADSSDDEALKRVELVDFDEGKLDFHTLGMALDKKTGTLFVSNHRRAAAGPSVEVFKLDVEAATATHLRTIEHPSIRGPNSIAAISDTEFYVTNDHFFLVKEQRLLSILETYLAPPLGTVVHVRLPESPSSSGDSAKTVQVQANIVTRLPFANGIEFLNSTTVAVASTSSGAVYLYSVTPREADEPAHKSPRFAYNGTKISVPFLPDNLSLTSGGSLLIAGHPHSLSTAKYAETRHICNDREQFAKADASMREYCRNEEHVATSWVSEWKPATRELKHLYSGTEYPSSATAVRDDGRHVGIVAGLYAKGIMVWHNE